MDGLINDQTDLEKKIRKYESALDQNKKDQVKESADLQSNINADDDTKKKNQRGSVSSWMMKAIQIRD